MNKSKKVIAALMLALAVVVAAGCTPDEQTDNGGNNTPVNQGKRLSKVTWVYDEGEYSNYETFTEVTRFTWSGDKISSIDCYEDGDLNYYINFTYNDGKLTEVVFQEGSYRYVYKCAYTGDKITHADVYLNDEYYACSDLTYDGAGHITRVNNDHGDLIFNLTWSGNNVVTCEVVDEGSYTYQYDNKIDPFMGDLGLWGMVVMEGDFYYLSANNLVRKQWNSLYSTNVHVVNYDYTYDGDYPLTCSYSSSDGSGTYYYEYVE